MVRSAHRRPLIGPLAAMLLGAAATMSISVTPAAAATAAPTEATAAPGFEGIVALSNCSGAVIRMPDSKPQDPALAMSNGHCVEGGMPGPGTVMVDKPSSRSFSLLNAAGDKVATLKATKLSYATMTDTDVSLYELNTTYEEMKDKHRIDALELDSARPAERMDIDVVSGFWKRVYSCAIDGFAHELREGGWTMKDSIRYTPDCKTIGGTSGSPVVNRATGKVVGVNNTGNENGRRCTLNNPCEVDKDGNVTVRPGINYGQQTYKITQCVTTGNKIDLTLPDCALPKP
ncbi:trypsin-like peptidase domain-containing protein [Streptomyces gobiensis]|uniref:trypsin-like peptidase domain-containing protein n=1 Tax=Streptomyces gobiensis TaxID=2875706 RepID=UPI001E54AF15|nr:trypsin-like peptidase domain-containing protein [Streptomyces gobiensis]UGY93357.1 serine protease [Streptomyces gobiensis]